MRAPALALLLFLAVPAVAEGGGEAPAPSAQDAVGIENAVEMPPLIAPVVQGRALLGYLYLDVVVDASAPGQIFQVRERAHKLQDAFVREVNGVPAAAFDSFDRAALQARLLVQANRVLGPGVAAGVVIRDVKASPR